MMAQRTISEKKIKEIALLKKYIDEFNVVGLVSMEKIGAKTIQRLRKALRGKVVMRMCKKRLMKRALEESESIKSKIVKLSDEIKGISAMIFTNMNPLSLSKFLGENSAKAPAKAGDIAPDDIIVSAGDTRIPPGPIISELNSILKLPTMIKDGTIHIREDTTTHSAGDPIDLKQALLLGRLGLEPMTVQLDFYAAWENGEIIPEDVLKLDQEKIIKDIQAAASNAKALAISLGVITEETVQPLLVNAFRGASTLALELGIMSPDTIPIFISKAAQTANFIENSIFAEPITEETQKAPEPAKKKKTEKKEEDSNVGLGGLFD
jgi:large subunit ribosomal protein L10